MLLRKADENDIKEINEALKTASKRNTGKVGKPEFICVVKDFLIVIEDKASISKHIKLDENDVISLEVKDVTDYAVNGAYFYGKILENKSIDLKTITPRAQGRLRLTVVPTTREHLHGRCHFHELLL